MLRREPIMSLLTQVLAAYFAELSTNAADLKPASASLLQLRSQMEQTARQSFSKSFHSTWELQLRSRRNKIVRQSLSNAFHISRNLHYRLEGPLQTQIPGGTKLPGKASVMPFTSIGICTIDLRGCCILALADQVPGQGPPPVSRAPLVELVSNIALPFR